MSSVVIAGDTSGSITLAAPAVAGTTTLTLPATSGTVNLNGPAFFAEQTGSAQSISNNTYTKLAINTETFDTNSNYNNSTYVFTPTVAGYYQVNANVTLDSSAALVTPAVISLRKNGTTFNQVWYATTTGGNYFGSSISSLVYCNGSTDYIEVYVLQLTGSTKNTVIAGGFNTFSAVMVRGA